jgi:membrane protein
LGNRRAKGELVTQIQGAIGKEAAQFIQTAIENASQLNPTRGLIPTLINIAVLFFGASVIFGQLQTSLNRIWDVQPSQETVFCISFANVFYPSQWCWLLLFYCLYP